jgi:hypothetical protein
MVSRRVVLIGYSGLGLLALAVGCAIVLYVYAFASMVDPELTRGQFWREVLHRMFLSGAVVPTMLGLMLALAGAVTAIWSAAAAAGMIADRFPGRKCWSVLLIGFLTLLALVVIIIVLA